MDEAQFTAILERIMAGQSLKEICDSPDTPARSTVNKYLSLNKEWADRYARACEIRAEHLFDEILEIADDGRNDWIERQDDQGKGYQENGEAIRRSVLRVDARKWALAKMQPKKYGDKVQIGGADDLPPVKTEDVTAAQILAARLDAIASRTSGAAQS